MALDIKLFYFFNNLAGQSRIFNIIIVFLAGYFQFLTIQVQKLLSNSQWFYSDKEWAFPSGHYCRKD
ncbi:MAG: hypothetical protein A3I88_02015 [Candidatus Portnoybacteria bacterium RIFCSPLOWO2_12_FULL_39_9]|uniref:Uncharacterized protein n=1 Tax=Candidatus Portnoybacteria bacterium RIFCSPHIGHO2_12_FULL_38_9 TaxID=1801997 RepID=A0A1G2FEW0_9BACT|nr:MAG: hypothetical protein A3H00_00560 [Candidatus Portnoybacteria bacterium RBG_13_40_8]OGZ36180.1 MAG: hypothetical protein A3J64_00235 [Candidatus Portnoybacteria bacterium RIFCSPHIGHO2_12_FULL_38_9]OGZ37206.1 MAG: hypothetical protein A2646_03405 [Candidatus Portnoybacteria bacterium RIFCSPHIGHO2_02_FULL_39_12]OGZ38585.1 MAG: hypothetical protein A3F21_01155 [Candidatus Portnoybacteria bacterium RIFCSPLOWO2_01_FULL_38_39]OGZ41226.1 MAG: hypothetical protein A3I88_02015 [Candidatus Portnoy